MSENHKPITDRLTEEFLDSLKINPNKHYFTHVYPRLTREQRKKLNEECEGLTFPEQTQRTEDFFREFYQSFIDYCSQENINIENRQFQVGLRNANLWIPRIKGKDIENIQRYLENNKIKSYKIGVRCLED